VLVRRACNERSAVSIAVGITGTARGNRLDSNNRIFIIISVGRDPTRGYVALGIPVSGSVLVPKQPKMTLGT